MMYARNLTSALAALPYQHKGVATPEMSRPRLIFAVAYGALYWVARELPLWACWVFLLSFSFGTFVADQVIPATEATVTYLGVPLVYGWMYTAGFTVLLTVFRLGLLILPSRWAIGVTLLILVLASLNVLL